MYPRASFHCPHTRFICHQYFSQLSFFFSLDVVDDVSVSVNESERSYDSAMDAYGQTDTTLCLVRVLFTAYHDDRVFLQACIPPTEASHRINAEDLSSVKSQLSQSQKRKLSIVESYHKTSAALPIDFMQDDVISSRYAASHTSTPTISLISYISTRHL